MMSNKDDLLERYSVHAHFYTLYGFDSDGVRWEKPCRSSLEITSKEKPPQNQGKGDVDAVFVMMNPGSSEPIIYDNQQEIHAEKISFLKTTLVRTYPDDTQFQVMRVMDEQKLAHVLVINLSDIRNASSNGSKTKSGEDKVGFSKEYKDLEDMRVVAHSIFCEDRRGELQRQLARVGKGPIVLAWGVGSYLRLLTRRAEDILSQKAIVGWAKSKESWKYYHPLPRTKKGKDDWYNNAIESLRAHQNS